MASTHRPQSPKSAAVASLETVWKDRVVPQVEIPLVVALTISLSAPSAYTPLVAGLLAVTLIASLATFGFPRRLTSAWPVGLYMALAVIMSFYGLQNLNPGATRVLTVPLIYLPFFAFLFLAAGPRIVRGLVLAGVMAGTLIGVQGLLYSLHNLGVVPFQVPLLEGTQNFVEYTSTYEVTSRGLGSLAFTVPLSLFLVFFGWWRLPRYLRTLAVVGLFSGIGYLLVAERRGPALALVLVAPFALWLAYLARLVGLRSLQRIVLGGLIVGGGLTVVLSVATGAGVLSKIQLLIDDTIGEATGYSFRSYQAERLLEEWQLSPIIGRGSGAYLPDFYSSEEFPWSYELSYIYLLFAWGILGFLVVAIIVIGSIVRAARLVVKTGYAPASSLALLVAEVGIIIANATNPYLGKFDGIWMVLMPLAVLNAIHISRPVLSQEMEKGRQRDLAAR